MKRPTETRESKSKSPRRDPKLPKNFAAQVEKMGQQGLSLDDIAGRFGVPVEALKESIESVRQEIDKLMEEVYREKTKKKSKHRNPQASQPPSKQLRLFTRQKRPPRASHN